MNPTRVAIVCDLVEENWPSMDLVGDMLLQYLQRDHAARIAASQIRPPMRRRMTRLPLRAGAVALNADRLLNRFGDYPRLLSRQRDRYDLFHLVDHSYSQLLHVLPAERTVITCHDLDTFRCVMESGGDSRTPMFRMMTRRILSGFQRAARVICDSVATRDDIVSNGLLPAERTVVIPIGVHPACSPEASPAADREAARWLGRPTEGAIDLLHVGSTVQRKRIDILLRVFAGVLRRYPRARLIRVGGGFSPAQAALARELGVEGSVVVLPPVDRDVLAAVYRRAALVLQPSEREGFGLPVVEALACGTPVLASDIAVLRETGGDAAAYAPRGEVDVWQQAVMALLEERREQAGAWEARRAAGLAQAAKFTWSETVRQIVRVYDEVLGVSPRASRSA